MTGLHKGKATLEPSEMEGENGLKFMRRNALRFLIFFHMKQTVGVGLDFASSRIGRTKPVNADTDVGLHCAAEAHSPPPSRLLTEEVEEDEEEGRVFILGLGIWKMEVFGSRASCG